MSYDNSTQVILSKVSSTNEKAPKMRITFEMDGQKYKCGLWPWLRKDGSPVNDKEGNLQYIGKWEVDNYAATVQEGGLAHVKAAAIPDGFAEDDIPF